MLYPYLDKGDHGKHLKCVENKGFEDAMMSVVFTSGLWVNKGHNAGLGCFSAF